MRVGRPEPWREVWHRLKTVTSEEEAVEAIGDLRELLAEEDLLVSPGGLVRKSEHSTTAICPCSP